LEDNPSYHNFPGGPATVEYRESLYIGYRYYDTVDQEVLFPFGHGLSYTSFEYTDLQLKHTHHPPGEPLSVKLKVRNIGPVAGKEIVQLYVRAVESSAFRPRKELKGFAKVFLDPRKETEVSFDLGPRAFAFYDPGLKDWFIEPGIFEILVGASSRDIRLQGKVEAINDQALTPSVDREALATYYEFPQGAKVSKEDFEALLGVPVPRNRKDRRGVYTLSTPISEMSDTFVGGLLYDFLKSQMKKVLQAGADTPNTRLIEAMIEEMPLRALLISSQGPFTRDNLDALLDMINGKYFKGVRGLIKAIRSN
jgi:beta-glucosidase